ncbi:unnamed protein product [Didymodactylos carnosus]|uniref:Uncharacterized protein n=1 Tax=Didymodactylos carnosus TaxID=1234261 RepID=A0A8S2Q8U0_9BILA|nr:unnamed protein product [Didymodactylos carnosus]CAF4083717.1 unnamed protein product [Didymodactylos carnosus]
MGTNLNQHRLYQERINYFKQRTLILLDVMFDIENIHWCAYFLNPKTRHLAAQNIAALLTNDEATDASQKNSTAPPPSKKRCYMKKLYNKPTTHNQPKLSPKTVNDLLFKRLSISQKQQIRQQRQIRQDYHIKQKFKQQKRNSNDKLEQN